MMISVFDIGENIVGNGENASDQRFSTVFSKALCFKVFTIWDCVVQSLRQRGWFSLCLKR